MAVSQNNNAREIIAGVFLLYFQCSEIDGLNRQLSRKSSSDGSKLKRRLASRPHRLDPYLSRGPIFMKHYFAAMILGGTGQVGGAAVAELLAIPECREVVMVTRKPIAARSRVRNVVLDTGAADFAERTVAVAREVLSQGPASAVSCVGVGSGSARWSEEELLRLEVGVVGAFARGCHDAGIAQFCLLSAVGSTARSRFRYARVMGMKEDAVRKIGFTRLAIFRPGIIVGNAHTPAWVGWLGSLVPGRFGNIDQRILGRSIAAEIALHSREAGEVIRENAAMKNSLRSSIA
jgi:uncharacterized protein YbjT (DUF2867 family)